MRWVPVVINNQFWILVDCDCILGMSTLLLLPTLSSMNNVFDDDYTIWPNYAIFSVKIKICHGKWQCRYCDLWLKYISLFAFNEVHGAIEGSLFHYLWGAQESEQPLL